MEDKCENNNNYNGSLNGAKKPSRIYRTGFEGYTKGQLITKKPEIKNRLEETIIELENYVINKKGNFIVNEENYRGVETLQGHFNRVIKRAEGLNLYFSEENRIDLKDYYLRIRNIDVIINERNRDYIQEELKKKREKWSEKDFMKKIQIQEDNSENLLELMASRKKKEIKKREKINKYKNEKGRIK